MSDDLPFQCAAGCGIQRFAEDAPQFMRCTNCLGAFYCGKKCQLKAWPDHKNDCQVATRMREDVCNDTVDDWIKNINYIKFCLRS